MNGLTTQRTVPMEVVSTMILPSAFSIYKEVILDSSKITLLLNDDESVPAINNEDLIVCGLGMLS